MRKSLLYMSIVLFISITSCLSIQNTVIDVKPFEKPMKGKNYKILGEAKGQSSSFSLLWFIPVTPRHTRKEAIEDAISEKGGDNLIEVRVWRERQIWLLGRVDVLYVKGKVIRYID